MNVCVKVGKRIVLSSIVFCGVLLSACGAGGLTAAEKVELGDQDPFENVNRFTYGFNDTVDNIFLEPTARVYRKATPEPAQTCLGNISDNLKEPARALGHAIAGHGEYVINSGVRFFFNTVVGGLGCLDVATEGMNLDKNDTDIGLAIRARMQPSKSVYLVTPIIGPSSIIDDTGGAVGLAYLEPLTTKSKKNPYETRSTGRRTTYNSILLLNTRAELLETTDLIDEAALDPYIFVREAYLERRARLSEEIRATKY